ncbi:proteasome assembly chaperone 1 [Eurosta solidaginis]|uniref:proteasome assembly chaperone 1 n=1 Tax=Eurosta solidaginis TaxID=178769 RepID=UPI0035307860
MSCPMGFGELNIPSSRAFWDDCDEDEATLKDKQSKKLELSFEPNETDAPLSSKLFLLIEGSDVRGFVEATLLQNAHKICTIPSSKSSLHYIRDKEILIAGLQEDLTNSGEVLELILPYAELADKVITITIKSKIEFQSENVRSIRDHITFLRGINSQLPHVEELEAPNFVAGVAAGIACWRHNASLPSSAYVAYTDNVSLDTLAAKPIIKLLQQLGINCSDTYKPIHREESHIYM